MQAGAWLERIASTVARHIDRDHPELGRQPFDLRIPRERLHADAVDQDQRFAAALLQIVSDALI
ncbi:hypothetical protein AB3X96_32435 [Paraburkholderia sp. BR13439]|uniref:hypothetical protein n=1 Tax=Paraburkholderia sp. BR13439 TaxID=3236996 RepID=UPI0034CEA24B